MSNTLTYTLLGYQNSSEQHMYPNKIIVLRSLHCAQFELTSSFLKNLSFNSFVQIDVAFLNFAWISKLFSAQYESDLNKI